MRSSKEVSLSPRITGTIGADWGVWVGVWSFTWVHLSYSKSLPMPSKEESTPVFLSIPFTAHQWNYGTCTDQELLDKRTTPSAIRVCSVERRVVVSVAPTVPHTVMCTVSAKKAHFCWHVGQRGAKNTILLQFVTFLSRLCSIKTSSRHVCFYKSPRAHCTKWG